MFAPPDPEPSREEALAKIVCGGLFFALIYWSVLTIGAGIAIHIWR